MLMIPNIFDNTKNGFKATIKDFVIFTDHNTIKTRYI